MKLNEIKFNESYILFACIMTQQTLCHLPNISVIYYLSLLFFIETTWGSMHASGEVIFISAEWTPA